MQKPMRSNIEVSRRLYSVAETQAGFFTAKQAQNAGFSASSHTYHVQEGHWTRESRGIYRLTGFPAALYPELTRWHLWAMDRAGRKGSTVILPLWTYIYARRGRRSCT